MSKRFVREIKLSNILFILGFIILFATANIYYSSDQIVWSRIIIFSLVMLLVLILKMFILKKSDREMDERMQYIIYRSLSVGFYFILGTVLWYYSKEITMYKEVSIRTYVELIAALTGYLGCSLFMYLKI